MLEHVIRRQQEINKGIALSIGGLTVSDEDLEKSANDFFEGEFTDKFVK